MLSIRSRSYADGLHGTAAEVSGARADSIKLLAPGGGAARSSLEIERFPGLQARVGRVLERAVAAETET